MLQGVSDAEAIAKRSAFLQPATVPRGTFSGNPSVPPQDIETLATTAVLAARPEVSPRLVEATLSALYQASVRTQFPILISRRRAHEWDSFPLHPTAQQFFDPYGGIGRLVEFMELFAGTKELFVAFVALLFLLRGRYKSIQEKQRAEEVQRLKDRLDVYLEETVRVERSQMQTTDVAKLKGFLDEVTAIKLKAIEELTHEDLRGDNHFAIFLAQCANLIQEIQTKAQFYDAAKVGSGPTPDAGSSASNESGATPEERS
ncbi:MAG: hypothetical protein AAF517_27985 [Planctomycetota bacterium]